MWGDRCIQGALLNLGYRIDAGTGRNVWPRCAEGGTTGRAAKILGRRALLLECDERWCEQAVTHLRQEVLPLKSPEPALEYSCLW
jgi:hypothetical protein